jgi:hypothetical protein
VFSVLTPEGLLFTAYPDAAATIRDVRRRTGDRVEGMAFRSEGWRPLGAGKRFLCLRHEQGEVRVVDMADPARLIVLNVTNATRRAGHVAVGFALSGSRGLVLHGLPAQDGVIGPTVTAFDLPDAKVAWERDLAGEELGPCRLGRMESFGDSAGVSLRFVAGANPPRCLVFNAADGAVFDCVPALSDHASVPETRAPVVMNGRVVVEHGSGVACFASVPP